MSSDNKKGVSRDIVESDASLTPQLNQLRDVLVNNDFLYFRDRIEEELNDLDNICTRMRGHVTVLMDEMEDKLPDKKVRMNTNAATVHRKKPSGAYVAAQVGNYATMKTLKANLLKQQNELKQSELDRAFKIINQINKDSKESGGAEMPLNTVLNALINMNIRLPTADKNIVADPESYSEDTDEILRILEEEGISNIDPGSGVTKGENLKTNTVEEEDEMLNEDLDVSDLDPSLYSIYYDVESGDMAVIDSDFNVVKELEEEELEYEESEDGVLTSTKYGLPIITSEESE